MNPNKGGWAMKKILMVSVLFVFLFGCSWIPARPALQEQISVSPGKIEGNHFTGIRYPFNVTVPQHWKMTTEFPDFLEDLGYQRPFSTDKEQTELYAYNPETKSNINFDFTPASRYSRFNQKKMEWITSAATESMVAELDKEFGKGVVKAETGPTEPISLRGVQYAAKRYALYTAKGQRREQGWIYAFTEPWQIFIIYTIFEPGGEKDREALKKILDSFEVIRKK
jgi:hypothetical protein